MRTKRNLLFGLIIGVFVLTPSTAQSASTYSLNLTLEVKQKYPGVGSPDDVIFGCQEGFPMDSDFTQSARWEVRSAKGQVVGTGPVKKVTVKNISEVPAPFKDASDPELLPYIYNGTCIYSGKVTVPKSASYSILFGGVNLNSTYSFNELKSKKWKMVIKKDLNCGGLYGKSCT
ncbi:hypothetical protein MCEMRE130_00151 [Candidatus Nanopelagicaceae bacterium]